jgi:hypothetical protein
MKRRGSYLGGSTVVAPGSDWFSKEPDPTSEDHKPTFEETLREFIREEVNSKLGSDLGANEATLSKQASARSSDAGDKAIGLIGYNATKHDPQQYVPAEEGRKFVKKRANSPFKRPKRPPIIEYKSKKD